MKSASDKPALWIFLFVLPAIVASVFVYSTLSIPGCPPAVFDCYGNFRQGGWPLVYLEYIGGGVARPVISPLPLLFDWLVFFIPLYSTLRLISRKLRLIK